MCGIVGYVGAQQAAPILLDGLRRLEYRGYDSAGMAVCGPEGLRVCKTKGRLQALAELTEEGRAVPGTLGVVRYFCCPKWTRNALNLSGKVIALISPGGIR